VEITLAVVGAMALLVVGIAVVPVVLSVIRAVRRSRVIRMAPKLEAEARIIEKRASTVGGGSAGAGETFFVTFQLFDGSRIELPMPASEAALLVIGDEGNLGWQASRYLGFTREILR
jgi:hypothetical protein